jgi:hypothetical protein
VCRTAADHGIAADYPACRHPTGPRKACREKLVIQRAPAAVCGELKYI